MLPVCSATPSCSSHSQIPFYGGLQPFYQIQKDFEVRCIVDQGQFFHLHYGTHSLRNSFKTQATKSIYSSFVESTEQSVSTDYLGSYSSKYLKFNFTNPWSSSSPTIIELNHVGIGERKHVEYSNTSAIEEGVMDFTERSNEKASILRGQVQPETISSNDITLESSTSVPPSLNLENESLVSTKESISDIFSGINDTLNASITKGENYLRSSLDTATSSIRSVIEGATKSADNAFREALTSIEGTGKLASDKLTNFSSEFNNVTSKATDAAINLLRHTIVAVESSLTSGVSFIIYSYGSVKELLPTEIRDAVNLYEDKATEILRPVGTASREVYIAIDGLEKSLGLDPNDPIVLFVVLLGSSASLWVIYWVWTYGGYSGDLSPKSTFELLTGNGNAVLIDVRDQVLRERDGIPDLRRGARFRYASVSLPEVDGSVRKLLKSGRDLDDSLIAVVIRNLKVVQDSSEVIIIDADGTCSKGIARSLKKLGVKNTYLVHGGFQSWIKQGLRIKELKPETALTILNEEAEAILEDFSPSPGQALGYGVVLTAALYALLEWEKTLQLIGIVGLGQTIYRRVASYEDSEDFKKDVRLLLAPVRLGAQAFSWAAGRLESNRLGLPTSPSSSDVQSRVLQAAAKHESQPSDSQDPSPETTVPVNENVDLSEA
ncbi:Calcium sensing receptor, chloroplastic [Quillaja saponaria]|uniref:Calcium sensing receptor, chloroplastic n=1 Tax=Quillaja saponaria TaxID=32244 RepID=A0AAD7VLQ8_QUISA|nr:Calcium sensing receptor, chloroplastic [Quillaja saponaria]